MYLTINTKMYWLHAISPLHVGSGQGVGFIDLPIMREKVTKWPLVPGSAVKGVIREHFVQKNSEEDLIYAAFGKGEDNAPGNAGALVLTDAHMVCMPVRSLYGTFAYITSPLALERLARDLNMAEYEALPPIPNPEIENIAYLSGSKLVNKERVFFEDLDFNSKIDDDTKKWAEMLSQLVFAEEISWQSIFKDRFGILSDDSFSFLTETGTEVAARVRIENDKKIVANGALWYEEALPSETILAGIAWCDKVRGGYNISQDQILKEFCSGPCLNLQIGGKANVGKGRARCIFSRGGA